MLAEKLLLNLLISIIPILLGSVLQDSKNKLSSPYVNGILHSAAAAACMIFSYFNYGFNWDLRYVPLILAFLYSGPKAGAMVFITISGLRLLFGGATVPFGLFNCLLTALLPIIIRKKFWKYSPNKRVLISVLVGIWSLLLCYLSLNIYRYVNGAYFKLEYKIPDLLMVGMINAVAVFFAAKLYEGIIERNNMKQEIQRAEKLNTLGELAASIAHEIRNPLTVVKGFLQLMKRQEQGKNYEYLTLVLSELGRAEAIITDYLNFAKPQFQKVEEFPLAGVITEIIKLLEPLAAKQGVQLEKKLDETEFILNTDRNQLKQALLNLIKNGIEATPEGGKVSIQFKIKENKAIVLITDTGKGMTHEQLSRIGTLFYTTKDKGTGLGTSVSLRIIETMNGKVSYQSIPGVGTEVMMILPENRKEIAHA
jgi:two-component system sporulation sensor kinase B